MRWFRILLREKSGMAPARRLTTTRAACPRKNGLFQENYGRENGDSQHEHQPFKIVALEPARKMQNQNDDCESVKGVEHFLLPP
jgi:hypothetical protein